MSNSFVRDTANPESVQEVRAIHDILLYLKKCCYQQQLWAIIPPLDVAIDLLNNAIQTHKEDVSADYFDYSKDDLIRH